MNNTRLQTATVVSVTRRYVEICTSNLEIVLGKSATRSLEPAVGDLVSFESTKDEYIITALEPRRNSLSRSYEGKTRIVACNLDMLCIVSAVGNGFNPSFIDRAAVAAAAENIPITLVVNKQDLETSPEETRQLVHAYASMGLRLLLTSALTGSGLDALRLLLATPDLRTVALTGISGVGKSSLINALIPGANERTQEVSKRGQGKQTTSQSFAHIYHRAGLGHCFIVDLPGIQHFGISHLTADQVRQGMPELLAAASGCRFSDCTHRKEPQCAVRAAVESGAIAATRYQSYIAMLDEIEASKPY